MKNKIFVVLVFLVLCVIFSKEVSAFGEYDLGGSLNPINVQISQDPYEVQRNANIQKEASLKSSYGTSNYYACYSTYESSCGITADVGNPYTQASCLSFIQYCLESKSLKESAAKNNVVKVEKSNDQVCTDKFGSYTQWDGTKTSDGRLNCGCKSGYLWNDQKTSCVAKPVAPPKTNNQLCQGKFGINSTWNGQLNANSAPVCSCQSGYKWNDTNTSCVAIPLPDNNQICLRDYGVNSVWIGELNPNGGPVCRCQLDYEFNANRTACVARYVPTPQPEKIIEVEKKETPKSVVVKKAIATSTEEIFPLPNNNFEDTSSAPVVPVFQVQPKNLWARIKSWFGFLKKDNQNDCAKEVDKWLDYNLGLWTGMNADRSGSTELEAELQAYRDEAIEKKQACY